VISQVYGGGGNTGAALKNDFIEIINHSSTAVDLTGWSVQYASATLSNWQVTPLTSFILQPGQYYLIKEAAGLGGTDELPPADAPGSIAMGATSGKVALVSNTTALTGTCPMDPAVIDFVGYDGANCFEGAGAAPALSNTTAALRLNDGCFDTNNNASNFVAGTPNPRNSTSSTHDCSTLFGIGSANPNSVHGGDVTNLTVEVALASNPQSTGITVVADLSAIGGPPAQGFTGTGNPFTFSATVAQGTVGGTKSLPVTIMDGQARSFSTSITLNVLAPHVVISQVYGGGGNSGATLTNDYVELFNPTTETVTITGWSLQYASAAGTTWTNKQPLGGLIAPGQYFLVSLGSGGSGGAPLPAANISGDINISATTGKIALVNNSGSLTGDCPLGSVVVDFVGYGTSATCHEGNANAPAPGNNTAIFRKGDGFTDDDQNGSDFIATGPPNPRRTAPIVELGPWVADTDPITNGTNAPHDATITVDFSEPVDVVGTWYDISCDSGKHNDATVAPFNGFKGYHITPNVGFQFGESCTVRIFKDQVHDQDLDDSQPNTDTLFEDYVWTFTVVGAGQPAPYPPDVHLTMGNPSDATASLMDPDNYLMMKPTYALSYNRDKGTPNWVSWHLDSSWFGTLARVDTFRADPKVPPDWYRVQDTDFAGSGFDRGHMTPNADRDNQNRIPINQETYLMSNMVPQAPDNNQGPWAQLEGDLRAEITNSNEEMYIVSGPLGIGGSGSNGGTTTSLAGGHVAVPAYTWKVALVLPQGEDDISRATCASKTIAVLMPNKQGIRTDDWHKYLTSVNAIEGLTGYHFFSNLPEAVQNCVKAGTNGTNPPGTANEAANGVEDNPVVITLQALRPNDASLTFSIVGGPAHGAVGPVSAASCNGGSCTATVTYTPGPEFNGVDSLNFKVTNGTTDSNVSSVSVSVSEVNDTPIPADDSKSAFQDTPLSFTASDLTANDLAGPPNEIGQTLTVMSVTATASTHGNVALNGGTVTYSPNTNYAGLASFTYQVCDNGTTAGMADAKCAAATVNVSVGLTSVVGLESVSISGSGLVDSYNSSSAGPSVTTTKNAKLLSNGTITLANSATVRGDVRSTQAGVVMSGASNVTGNATAGTTVSRAGGAVVAGTITNNAPSTPMVLPAVPACGPSYSSASGITGSYLYNTGTGDLSLTGPNIATLSSGNYCFHNLTLSNSAQLKTDGTVTIRLTGALNVSGAAKALGAAGIPGNLRVLSSYGGAGGVTIGNSASVLMIVYAPQTGVSISGTGSLSGTAVGKSILVSTGGMIHYDTETKNAWQAIWSLVGATP
jgi:endonuclease G